MRAGNAGANQPHFTANRLLPARASMRGGTLLSRELHPVAPLWTISPRR